MPKTQALIYCRVASDTILNRSDSITSQVERCRAHAENMGYEVVRVFCDKAISGNIVNRPALQELVSYVRRGGPEPLSVIVENISRLGRSQQAFANLCAAIRDAGGSIVFVDS